MYIDFAKLSEHDKALLKKAIEDCGYNPEVIPEDIPFGFEIPLDGAYVMEGTVINEGTSFYPGGIRNLGGSCYVRLTGDGSVSPNFLGMAVDINSSDYRVGAGVVNCVSFWYDGTQVFYRITCASNMGVPPATIDGSEIDFNTGNKAILSFTHNLSPLPLPEVTCFSVIYNNQIVPVISVLVDDDTPNRLILNLNIELDSLVPCLISYVPSVTNPLTDSEGYTVAAFSNVSAMRPD